LISRTEGEKLIAAVTRSQVIIELAWDVPTNHVVVTDLWMSSGSRESMKFLKDFSPKRKALNDAVKFVPHYHVFGMTSSVAVPAQDYNDLCSASDAQYCAEDPDGSGPVTGKMVLDEDVRQLCIHELTKVKHDPNEDLKRKGVVTVEYAAKFWDYVEKLMDRCPVDGDKEPAERFGRECSEALMRDVGIDADKVRNCVMSTKEDKLRQERQNVAWSPRALRINGWRYSGTMDADLVTRAICAGFIRQPDACAQLVEPVNPFKNMPHDPPQPEGISFSFLFIVLLIIATCSGGVLVLYKHTLTKSIHTALREEVMLEVQSQMDTYKQLGGNP